MLGKIFCSNFEPQPVPPFVCRLNRPDPPAFGECCGTAADKFL